MTVQMGRLKKLITKHEGLRLSPYRCTAGKLTIGVGHNLDDKPISERAAAIILEDDILDAIEDLNTRVKFFTELNEVRQHALIDMCFNLGSTRLLKFKKMFETLETGEYGKAADEARDSAWFRQVGSRAVTICRMIRNGE